VEILDTLVAILENSRGWNAAILALISFSIYALVSNLSTLSIIREQLASLESGGGVLPRTAAGAVLELLRFGYYVGIPFLALYFGWMDRRVMGLGLLDWAEGLQWAIILLLAAWLILMAIWLPYLRATSDVLALPNAQRSFARRSVEIIYMQSHWAFYRAAAITLLTGIVPDAGYWGVAIGLGLIFLEAFTNPEIRQRLAKLGQADNIIWNSGQALINSLGFLVTANFYLLILIHFILEISVPHLRAAHARRSAPYPSVFTPQRVREKFANPAKEQARSE
jgi:hypothetical protein